MSDLIESEAANNPAYRRFRSEYRGKRWLYQKLLRDTHGRLKQPKAIISSDDEDSPVSTREQRLLELRERRETDRKERLEHRSALRKQQEQTRKEIEEETFNYLVKSLKKAPNTQKDKREEALKRECAELNRKKGPKVSWAPSQPQRLLRSLQTSLS
jgi:hypothetical protein